MDPLLRQRASVTMQGMKILLNLIGAIAVVLGVLGIFLPLLPTTPFLLLASACFARGSTRLHNWLITNPMFGRYLRNYELGYGIPLRAKVWILLLMWLSLGYSAYVVQRTGLQIMLFCIGCGVTLYLCRYVPTMRLPVPEQDGAPPP